MSLTRRRLLTTSGAGLAAGGAAGVLAACGGDGREERSSERDAELLQVALGAQATVAGTYELAADQALGRRVARAVADFAATVREDLGVLAARIEEAGGTADAQPGGPPQAESVVESIRIALEQAISAGHGVVGALSTTEARRAVYRMMTGDAAQLAAIRGVLGEQQVPVAFVTGGPEEPLAIDPDTGSQPEGGS